MSMPTTTSWKAGSDSRPAVAIEASGLLKVFGKTRAVDGVDLAVPNGMVYGLLGPNGADHPLLSAGHAPGAPQTGQVPRTPAA
jgi:ABC-type transporter Mla maintaining outer membrane lipid asymmetry ATPase subunit MlaF